MRCDGRDSGRVVIRSVNGRWNKLISVMVDCLRPYPDILRLSLIDPDRPVSALEAVV
jgi:hypothetical protein